MEQKPVCIVVSGWRGLVDSAPVVERLARYAGSRHTTLIHGDCRGVDRFADRYARERGWDVLRMPAVWDRGLSAGPQRNVAMLHVASQLHTGSGYDVIVETFPSDDSVGTKQLIKAARRGGFLVFETKVGP